MSASAARWRSRGSGKLEAGEQAAQLDALVGWGAVARWGGWWRWQAERTQAQEQVEPGASLGDGELGVELAAEGGREVVVVVQEGLAVAQGGGQGVEERLLVGAEGGEREGVADDFFGRGRRGRGWRRSRGGRGRGRRG